VILISFEFFIEFHLIPTKVHCPDVETSPPQAAGLELVVRAWWRGARSGCGPKEAGCGNRTLGVEMIPWKESFVDLSESLHSLHCIQISAGVAGVLLSDGLAEKNSLWWRHGWCP